MTVWCAGCLKWSLVPVDGGREDAPHALCEHCGAMLDVGDLYYRCACCGRYHRNDYAPCALCAGEQATVGGLSGGQATTTPATTLKTTAADAGPGLSIGGIEGAPHDRKQERTAEYYWRLYMDYRPSPSLAGTAPVRRPAPVPSNGHERAGSARNHAVEGRAEGGRPAEDADAHGVDLAVAGAGQTPAGLFSHIGAEEDEGEHVAAPTAPHQQQEDVSTAKASAAGNYNEFDYELIQDPSRLAEVAELLAGESVIGVDTETDGLDPYTSQLLLLQIATPDRVYIVDCKRVVPLVLKPLLENPGVLKVAQNAKFDYEMLRQQAGITLTNLFDTMLAERIMTAGIGREISLRLIAQKYLGAILDKTVRESFHASRLALRGDAYLSEEQLHYAARDAHIMIPIWRHQTRELKKLSLTQIAELEFRCIPAVGDLELAGVRIDEARWRKIIEDVAVQRDRAAAELAEMLQPASMQATMFGVSAINLNSSSQLIEAFARLGVHLPDTMEATLARFNHPAVQKLLEYRAHEKTLSAFGENVLSLINPKTGRIHPDFNQHGADTGRFSCTRPNIQQIPATSDFRKCFIAADGYKLITCVAEGTRVSTCRGLVPVQHVQVGDLVVQEDGSARRVLRVLDQGERPTVRITTAHGYELVATPEHRVRVLDDRGNYVWREAGSLKQGALVAIKTGDLGPGAEDRPYVLLPGIQGQGGGGQHDAVSGPPPVLADERVAFFMGYITGGGTFAHDYIGWVINSKDMGLAAIMRGLSVALLAHRPMELARGGVVEHRVYSPRIRDWLLSAGASRGGVPPYVWASRASVIASYLRGLFEGAGSIQGAPVGKVGFSTSHAVLASQVQQLLRALGIDAIRRRVVHGKGHGKGRGLIWTVTIPPVCNQRFARIIGFASKRRQSALNSLLWHEIRQESGAVLNMRYRVRAASAVGLNTRATTALPGDALSRASVSTVSAADTAEHEHIKCPPPPPARYAEPHSMPDMHDMHDMHDMPDNGMIFDRVACVQDAGVRRVYDLTVEGTSTYITDGFVSHNCDYSQAELRILAELSGDEAFINAFKSGQDLHSLTASQMFGVPLESVTKPQRSAAKAINFGLAYGMGPGGLAPRLGVSLDEAKELIAKYFKAYPGIQKWLDRAAKDAVRNGYSLTPLGRKRFYTLPDESLKRTNEEEYRRQIASIERQGKNSPIQGANADMTKLALIYLRRILKDYDARTVNTVHDEIVVEVREDQAEEVRHIVEREMVRAGQAILKVVPVVAEATVADYWSK